MIYFPNPEILVNSLDNWVNLTLPISEATSTPIGIVVSPTDNAEQVIPIFAFVLGTSISKEIESIENICNVISNTKLQENSLENFLFSYKIMKTISPSLISITLIDCGIESFSSFHHCPALEFLYLPFNHIVSIEDIPQFSNLSSLDVSFNRISTFSGLIPKTNLSLSTFLIFGNPICSPRVLSALPQIFSNLKEQLNFPNVPIIDFKPSNLNIKFLDLSHNCLTSLSFVNDLPCLQYLNVSYNLIHSADVSSTSLKHLNISFNLLNNFPNIPSLEHLEINSNKIKNFITMPNLISLFACRNQINIVPNSEFFPNLCILSIESNPIASSPDLRILFLLPKLKVYNCQKISTQNHLKAQSTYAGIVFEEDIDTLIPPNEISVDLSKKNLKDVNRLSSSSVQYLILNDNNLSEIVWGLNSFSNLTQIKLANNLIQSFSFFSFLPLLNAIDLSFNHLTDDHLSNFVAYPYPNLKYLILSNNSFRTIAVFNVKYFPSLDFLDLSHNHISKVLNGALTSLNVVFPRFEL